LGAVYPLRLAVEGFSNRELQLYAAYSPHFLRGRFFGVVVNTQLPSAEAALCLDALDRQLAEHFGLPFLYAFGGVGRGLDYLQVSRRNAEIVMQYAFFVTDKALLSDPEFIRRCEQRPDSLDPRHIRRIEDALKSQNVPAAQAAVTHFFEQIRSQEHNARSVHQACRSLIRCFEQSVREASANSMIAVSVGEMLAGAQSARSLETCC
jgi:hypothetical protein